MNSINLSDVSVIRMESRGESLIKDASEVDPTSSVIPVSTHGISEMEVRARDQIKVINRWVDCKLLNIIIFLLKWI